MKNAPRFLLNQHRLIWVDISHNRLSGALSFWLPENNTDLKFLNLRNNLFIGNLDPFPENPMSGMVYMDVSHNRIEGLLPMDLGLPSCNLFEGELPSSEFVENCIDLVGLMLNNNNFNGEFFSTHFNLSGVQVLRLGNNKFAGSLLTKKEFYSSMKLLDVSNNNMAGEIPNGIDAKFLLLQNNSLEGQFPREGFYEAQIIDCLETFLPNLVHFFTYKFLLGNNLFDVLIPRQLCQLTEISILDLSNNSFSGPIPSCLSDLPFGSDSNYFFEEFTFSDESRTVDVHNLLQELYDFINFWNISEIDAKYGCKIDFVKFLNSLGKLSSLHGLNLFHNHLTGQILGSFSNLSEIENMDLSYNNLSGKIPSKLVKLNFLEVFSVSHNNLSGRVPDKGQFATFGISSYEGIPFLSGPTIREKPHDIAIG
ncbi:receptor-like protein 56 [Hibiscus syriacus]|uniref:receptor-like protein 56 n=1 Tax=Hibiscus syriacus TaxID=106335 RepID=UPI0019211C3D|nr:receptor-like protein 56 [Hibiscus syriacus]